jgi:hypothetical protein
MEILFLIGLTFLASIVGTVTGFGTSTIMVPILVFFFPLPVTLLFVGIIHWFGDIWKILLFSRAIKWRLTIFFGIPAIFASYLGASLVISIPEDILLRILGGFLLVYSIFSLFVRISFKSEKHSGIAVLGGFSSGFIVGIVGVGGEVRAAFLSAFNLPKEVYLATIGVIAFVTDLTRLGTYLYNEIRLPSLLLTSLIILIPVSFIGAKIAQRIVYKVPERHFQKAVLITLFLLGVKLLIIP